MLSPVCGHALMQALLTTSEQCVAETRAAGTEGGGGAYLCPVSVDWQSPDRESQILMVLSRLQLAICFPSGLHATDSTLKLREVSTRINTKKGGKIWKNLPFRVAGQLAISRSRAHRALANVHVEIIYIYIIFEHAFINNKFSLRVVYLTDTQNRNIFC